MPTNTSEDQEFYLVCDASHERGRPNACDNLTDLFGLSELASSVARFDATTGEKRKLRKSYKNQIADLPGKHTITTGSTPGTWSLYELARQPPRFGQSAPALKHFDQKLLGYALSFDKTPVSGIPDFDMSLLGVSQVFKSEGSASPPANNVPPGIPYHMMKERDGVTTASAESSDESSFGIKRKRPKKGDHSLKRRKHD